MIDYLINPITIFFFLGLITGFIYYFKKNAFLKLTFYSFYAVILTVIFATIFLLLWEKFIGSTGFAGFVLFYPAIMLVFPTWLIVCRRKLSFSWGMTSLAAIMPFMLFFLSFEISDVLKELDQPRRDREIQIFYANSELKRIKEYLERYKEKCGHYPDELRGILKESSCWPEKEFTSINYRDGDFLNDPWGHIYLYENSQNKRVLKTLGRDQRIGGEDVDQDRSIEF